MSHLLSKGDTSLSSKERPAYTEFERVGLQTIKSLFVPSVSQLARPKYAKNKTSQVQIRQLRKKQSLLTRLGLPPLLLHWRDEICCLGLPSATDA